MLRLLWGVLGAVRAVLVPALGLGNPAPTMGDREKVGRDLQHQFSPPLLDLSPLLDLLPLMERWRLPLLDLISSRLLCSRSGRWHPMPMCAQ